MTCAIGQLTGYYWTNRWHATYRAWSYVASVPEHACVYLQDFVQWQDLLFGSRTEEIMTRIGQVSLIQRKVRCCATLTSQKYLLPS